MPVTQDTDVSVTGTVSSFHLVPFQCSANVPPMAMQLLAAVQSTLVSATELVGLPGGLGVLCTVQLVPFHRSASVTKP